MGASADCARKEARKTSRSVAFRRLPLSEFCCLLGPVKRQNSGENVNLRLPVILLFAGLAGCVSGGGEDWRIHYVSFGANPPEGNRVTVCHAYTCKEQTPYTFNKAQIAEIKALMKKIKRSDTPFEERRAVAYAISYMEVKVGKKLGIKDVAGMQFTASGDPSQQDCVDEATNTTSYLLVLQSNGLLKHHTVSGTMSKENLAKGFATLNPVKYWPHWTAVLTEKETGQKYAIDSWLFPNGENPAVVKVEDWYIKDSN
jgi:hypothetical protein